MATGSESVMARDPVKEMAMYSESVMVKATATGKGSAMEMDSGWEMEMVMVTELGSGTCLRYLELAGTVHR